MLPSLRNTVLNAGQPIKLPFQCRQKHKLRVPIQLLRSIPSLGKEGDVVEVRETKASPKKTLEQQQKEILQRLPKINYEEVRGKLEHLPTLEFTRKVLETQPSATEEGSSDNQGIYGSVTQSDIAMTLRDKHFLPIDKEWVQIDSKIKTLGSFEFLVTLPNTEPVRLQLQVTKHE
ncbi:hypothetical protein H4219_000006 [Mycoemilia scoparia]|uniref:50S ribosomal protein L9, chloroplastic n=1 Tax=Mycoemilia scoparia TaxID=417184 RepID=A0A9W8A4A1_9FUNG|nr:hypothetical protein H4219_000006 [Mycoemilia scoparia]